MKKQTYKLIQETVRLLAVIGIVIALSLMFYALTRILEPRSIEASEDEAQTEEMRNYHRSQQKNTSLHFFNN